MSKECQKQLRKLEVIIKELDFLNNNKLKVKSLGEYSPRLFKFIKIVC